MWMIILNPYEFSVQVCGLVLFGSGEGAVAGLFEHGNDVGSYK
jgi:hypothetical protein